MKSLYLRGLVVLCAALLLSACMAPKTPQEVAQRFWESVIVGDAEGAVEHSTLVSARDYDAFSRDWSGFQPAWGKVVIEGEQASIVSEFSKGGEDYEKRALVTYLVRQNDRWKVDYQRTGESLRGGSLARLFEQLGELGRSVSEQFRGSAQDIGAEMERLAEQLRGQSALLSLQAEAQINEYSESLRQSMDELAESIERALKEREKSLSEPERRTLQEVATDLNEGSERLESPSMQTLADGSKNAMRAQQRLEAVDEEAVGKAYKQQWRAMRQRVEGELRQMLDELAASLETGE
jgi:hypothetical protein